MSAGARKTALNTTRSWQQHFVGQATQNMAMSFIGCGPQPRKTMFSLLTPGCNTLESDIKQFALLCEQNVEALWRSVWKFVYQVIMFGYFDLVALLTAMQLTGAKHGQWCRAVVRQVEIIIINHHDSNRIACKIPCHHSASVDSLSGFASSCWIGSLRKLDCPSNP